MDWLDDLAAKNPTLLSLETIGHTFEGRKIQLAKVSTGGNKPIIYYQGGIHAREWISPAVMQYMLGQVLNGANAGGDISNMLDLYDLHLVMVLNADGYAYTWTDERLWRKTRSTNRGSSCMGTDANRNWGNHWAGAGTSSNPCSDIYRGPRAFSELCVAAVRDYMVALRAAGRRIAMAVDVHSYGQYYMSPWGWTTLHTPDHTDQMRLMRVARDAIRSVHGLSYTIGPSAETLYPAAGGSDDWWYGDENQGPGIKWSFVAELRDLRSFIIDASQIVPNGEEFLASVTATALWINEH
jgi:hypothetical protein